MKRVTLSGRIWALWLASLAIAATGCGNGSRNPGAVAESSAPACGASAGRPVAYVGAQPVSLAEVEASVAHDIYASRTVAMRDLLTRKLIEAEARRRNVSVQELLRAEVEAKLSIPNEAELKEFFTQAQAEGRIDPHQDFEKSKDTFLGTRTKALRSEREYAFVKELYEKAQVRVDLDGLGRPPLPPSRPGPIAGAPNGPIVLVEYTDFKSPFCKQANATLERLLQDYPTSLKIVFRHKPAPNDEASVRAAEAALCAADQQQYWKYRQALFARQDDFSEKTLVEHAEATGLNADKFRSCLTSGKHRPSIEQDVQEARSHHYEGSPVYSLNGTRLSGAHELGVFKELIDTELTWRSKLPESS
jgi:predicted DsbA family dithiol-disulfide isomerase